MVAGIDGDPFHNLRGEQGVAHLASGHAIDGVIERVDKGSLKAIRN